MAPNNLLIPCCGDLCYHELPAFLSFHPNGNILLKESFRGLNRDNFDRIIITILKEHAQKYNARKIIEENIEGVEILELEARTQGPANTIYETIKRCNIDGSIVVKDSDNYLMHAKETNSNYVAGVDIYQYNGEIRELKKKSFLSCNEQRHILDIKEKMIASNVVCLGEYGFANANDFVFAYENLKDSIYGLTHLYVSQIIAYLIGFKEQIFDYIPVSEFINWGNKQDLSELKHSNKTVYINYHTIVCADSSARITHLIDLMNNGVNLQFYVNDRAKTETEVRKELSSMGIYDCGIIFNDGLGAICLIDNATVFDRIL